MTRYTRQTLLPELGADGQAAFAAAHALVVGAGGLGAPVLQYLVAAGVGRITLVDGDTVSLSNLHRQTLFREGDVGQPKADTAAQNLRGLNSDVTLTPVTEPLTPRNAPELVAAADIVLDCADSFAASYTLSDICLAQGKPLITASVLGRAGYVGGFCGTAPSLRAVFPDLPDRAATCVTAGVMGPVVGMIGAAQAQMALAQLAGMQPSPLGQMISFDMVSYRTSSFRFDAAPEPTGDIIPFIAVTDIAATDTVIDLRGVDEAPETVTPDAARLTVADIPATRPEPASRAVLVCKSGLRAWQAASHMRGYWDGPITLIAMGDAPENERQPQ